MERRRSQHAGHSACLFAVLLLVLGAASAGDERRPVGPLVRTDLGTIRGVQLGRGAAFRGIPFAAPPIGALRWRAARQAAPWRGVRPATAFGAICPQPPDARTTGQPQSEDCLTLNVVTPDLK